MTGTISFHFCDPLVTRAHGHVVSQMQESGCYMVYLEGDKVELPEEDSEKNIGSSAHEPVKLMFLNTKWDSWNRIFTGVIDARNSLIHGQKVWQYRCIFSADFDRMIPYRQPFDYIYLNMPSTTMW